MPADPAEDMVGLTGFVGLGAMGRPMATRLAAERPLVVFDLDPEAGSTLAAEVTVAADLGELARRAETVILMLPDSRAVAAVVAEMRPALAPGSLLIDMSSSDPIATRELAASLEADAIELLDAPVSGGVSGAEAGSLATIVGGSEAALARALPLLEAMTSRLVHVGDVGAGHAVKALNNLLSAAGMLITTEALRVAERFGIEEDRMLSAVNVSSGRNYATEHKFPSFISTGKFDSGFRLGLMTKDIATAQSLAEAVSAEGPMTALVAQIWNTAEERIGGQRDHTEVVRIYEATPSIDVQGDER